MQIVPTRTWLTTLEESGWRGSLRYVCRDRTQVVFPQRQFQTDTFSALVRLRDGKPFIRVEQQDDIKNGDRNLTNYALDGVDQRYACPRNGISVQVGRYSIPYWLVEVSGLLMKRDLRDVYRSPQTIRTCTLPRTMYDLRSCTFQYRRLVGLRLNEGLGSLGWSSCAHTSLRVLALPSSLRIFSPDIFRGTKDLLVVLPEGIRIVDANWSLRGVGLQRLQIPASAEVICAEEFKNCDELREVVVPPGSQLRRIEAKAFKGCALTTFQAPPGLRTLGDEAFADCPLLAVVELNEGLEVIGARCFAGTALETIRIPESVREIGEDAFLGCRNMSSAGEPARGPVLRGADLLKQCIVSRAEVFGGEEWKEQEDQPPEW